MPEMQDILRCDFHSSTINACLPAAVSWWHHTVQQTWIQQCLHSCRMLFFSLGFSQIRFLMQTGVLEQWLGPSLLAVLSQIWVLYQVCKELMNTESRYLSQSWVLGGNSPKLAHRSSPLQLLYTALFPYYQLIIAICK